MTVFDDGSGIAIEEWRGEYEYREHVPRRPKPTPWERDNALPEFAGISNRTDTEIPRALALALLQAWRESAKRNTGGWTDL